MTIVTNVLTVSYQGVVNSSEVRNQGHLVAIVSEANLIDTHSGTKKWEL